MKGAFKPELLDRIFVWCAFSFIYTEILSTGVKQEVKLLKQKLRLTEEWIDNVRKIISSFSIKEVDKNSARHN